MQYNRTGISRKEKKALMSVFEAQLSVHLEHCSEVQSLVLKKEAAKLEQEKKRITDQTKDIYIPGDVTVFTQKEDCEKKGK